MKIQVNLKIDADVKKQAQKQASNLGLSLSSIVNATLKQFARTGELELSTAPKVTPYLQNLVIIARDEFKKGKTSNSLENTNDIMEYLNS